MEKEILKMSGISKSFFGVEVLHKVSLTVHEGKVHALLGENGAGKSTLMNILGGVYTKDDGTVVFHGEPLENMTVKNADDVGIAFVHQELNLFNELMVYENIFIGKEILKHGLVNKRAMIKECQRLFADLGVDISATEYVGKLNTGKKQLLEIAKALHQDAKLIILDEPTTALSNNEIDHLFNIIHRLKEKGVSFIFISHKMPEIFKIADEYSVLRNGYFISSGLIKDTTPEQLTKDIVGQHYVNQDLYVKRDLGDVILSIKNLSGNGFSHINLDVKKGEIIGLTGLQGAGSSELIQAIFGAELFDEGEILVKGQPLSSGSIKKVMKRGIGMIPANRKENSIIPEMSLLENNSLAHYQLEKKPLINYKHERSQFEKYRKDLSIKCNSRDDLIVSLSGGNQQKVIVGRWLYTNSDILLLDNPTQGIDVGAKSEIYKLILKLAQEGKTIIFNTLEVSEIQKVADRCCVFYHGQIEKILNHNEITEEVVMMYATNAHKVQLEKEEGAQE
jgi:hypothetical protein